MAKLFCFTFCNSYGGFVYLAFIGEPVVGVDCEKSCMSLLATNLTIVFVVQLLVRMGKGKGKERKGRGGEEKTKGRSCTECQDISYPERMRW